MRLPPCPRWTQCGYVLVWASLLVAVLLAARGGYALMGHPENLYWRGCVIFAAMSLATVAICLWFAFLEWGLRQLGVSLGGFMRRAEEDHQRWKEDWAVHTQARQLEQSTASAQGRQRPRRL